MKIFPEAITKDQVRDTGMAVVLFFLVIGFLFNNLLYFKIAIPLLLINMVIPVVYKPIAVIWLGLSHVLGTIVSRIVLTLVFLLVVTPLGVVRRLLGFDSLQLMKFKQGNESVMKIRDMTFTRDHIEKPY